ncbi:MAG: Anthranilate synthase component 1 [Syntrophaceae bacterium PtaU1.Bin231]|nr:MAG: Anthranilate synthase component 1 [Syntrophaceae bacterium PtaU1.Bin231]HOG15916.1 anthranilate synthase component I [Syntrophales bacterium]
MSYLPDFEQFQRMAAPGTLVPVCREILADTETPVSALMKLRDSSHSFLLESAEGGEKWGRYSLLGADPRLVLRIRKERIQVAAAGGERTVLHDGDPLKYLKKLLADHRFATRPGLPRFAGGAVGYLAYDMVRHFERLPDLATDDLGSDDAAFMLTDTVAIFDNVRHTIQIIACAPLDEGADVRAAYERAVESVEAMIRRLRSPRPAESGMSRCKAPAPVAKTPPEDFRAMVSRAREYILAGDVIQVVLSQRFETDCAIDPVSLYRALRFINPSPYMFFFRFGESYLIGSSPEAMVRLENENVELRPIAGTRKRGGSEQEDRRLADELLRDPKERAEHVMLVDLGRNDLGRIAKTGSVQVGQFMAVERYSHVMHLVSHVQAQLADGKDAFDVLRATFPAGTLSGAPKVRAMEIIEELEGVRRGPYGGAVGYLGFNGNMDLGITIRSLLLQKGRIYIQTGAGIVADSDPEAELRETQNKAEAMFRAIGMAASGLEECRG